MHKKLACGGKPSETDTLFGNHAVCIFTLTTMGS